MVLRHVGFELFSISVRGWLPFRFFTRAIEVIGKVFRVGVADFPTSGEAGFGLKRSSELYRKDIRLIEKYGLGLLAPTMMGDAIDRNLE